STTLRYLSPGDPVNLEADLLAKYTERLLGFRAAHPANAAMNAELQAGQSPISAAWLAEHGWS
ncbi:MAG: riboflavin synthase, partial [Vulcanococcus sp.]